MLRWGYAPILALLFFSAMADTDKLPAPISVTTKHKISLQGKSIRYQAVAEQIRIHNQNNQPCADIFSISYLSAEHNDQQSRPVTFVFNGGPGSSSVWLHLGLLGPQRVVIDQDAGDDGAAPFKLRPNIYSLLDITDLVMIDPVGSGFSEPLSHANRDDFWGVSKDAESLATFIRQWLTKHNRWNSPKYLAGESYGATRTAYLTEALHNGFQDVALNGVILISAVLDFSTIRRSDYNINTPVTALPTMAAIAWYHGKITGEPELEPFLDRAREFALTEYAAALYKGNRLSEPQRQRILEKLVHFTGLPKAFLQRANLYVDPTSFRKELLRDRSMSVGRLDGRYLGQEENHNADSPDADPSGYGVSAAYTAAINHYLINELKLNIDRPYEILSMDANRRWDWHESGRIFGGFNVDVTPKFSQELRQNHNYRIFIANGYYDLATPFLGTETSLARHHIPADKVTLKYYSAGHMMYVHHESLEQLAQDIREFILHEK